MSAPLLIIGGGGHAKVLIDSLRLSGSEIAGILVADPAAEPASCLGVPVLGGDELLERYSPEQIRLVNAVGSVRRPEARQRVYETLRSKGFRFACVVHPSAVIGCEVELGEGVQVMAGAVLQPGTRVGENSIVNTRASIDHDCRIGAHVHLAPGAVLSGAVEVGSCSHIGTGATVIQGIAIGRNCVVGAGSVVIKNVADATTVVGVPARSK